MARNEPLLRAFLCYIGESTHHNEIPTGWSCAGAHTGV